MMDGSTQRLPALGKSKLNRTKLEHDYKTVEDGEEMQFVETTVKCILTPGHTEGSMSYLANGSYLFVGDNLSLRNGKVELFDSVFNMSDDTQRNSLKKLAHLQDIQYLLTAHYGFTDSYQKSFKNWI